MSEHQDRMSARERLLLTLTGIPTAAGREDRVIMFIERWVADRPPLRVSRDTTGNLWIAATAPGSERPATREGVSHGSDARATGGGRVAPIVFEAHLDHPAFVIRDVMSQREVWAEFRGGVKTPYFERAAAMHHGVDGRGVRGHVLETIEPDEKAGRFFRRARLEFEEDIAAGARDIVTWDLPAPRIEDGRLRAPVCDDLAAVAAALSALEELALVSRSAHGSESDAPEAAEVRVLLTRAEEVGFVGAIAACTSGAIPAGSRIIALENSRSFAESPIGAGPIVRVGDRLSVFSPGLTAAVAKVAQRLAGRADQPVGSAESAMGSTGFRWQRKLMPGGACEASAFCAFGYEATCVCLPLGNYHNMGRLDETERALAAGEPAGAARIEPEEISVADFHHLVDLLVACGRGVSAVEPLTARLERMYSERAFVLDD